MVLQHDIRWGFYTVFMGKTLKKEFDILFLNLIKESERDFLTFAIKIHLKNSGNDIDPNKISGNPEISNPCTSVYSKPYKHFYF